MGRPAANSASPSAKRAAQVLKILTGRTNMGIEAGAIATALNIPPTRVTGLLRALEEEGLITEVYTNENQETGRYAHSMGLLQMAYDCIREDQLIKHRIDQKQKILMDGVGK